MYRCQDVLGFTLPHLRISLKVVTQISGSLKRQPGNMVGCKIVDAWQLIAVNLMVRQVVEFEVQSISQENAASLKTKDVVQITLQPQGRLQIQVGKLGEVATHLAGP
jgi:hypothetical protein